MVHFIAQLLFFPEFVGNMNKLIKLFPLVLFAFYAFPVFAGGNMHHASNAYERTFIKNNKRLPDLVFQQHLRNQASWQNFLRNNGNWWVQFNEENRKPHRAYGKPIDVQGATPEQKAMHFVQQHLQDFAIPVNDLVWKKSVPTAKHTYVHFYQKYQGLQVLGSKLLVKLNDQGKVILFGADVYSDIALNVQPFLSPANAAGQAMYNINETILNTEVKPDLCVLPIPENKENTYHLVYQVEIETKDDEGIPARYYTLVDAHSGAVLYRHNTIRHLHGTPPPTGIEIQMQGEIYPNNSFDPTIVVPFPDLSFVVSGNAFQTDAFGSAVTGISGPQSVNFSLSGNWVNVQSNGITPVFSGTCSDGLNTITFSSSASNIRERSAFYHVNVAHDHCKSVLPAFTGMDFSLPANIDISPGTCNAYYDGSSINFFAQGGGCTSFATVADVIYHEYGHGINHSFYTDGGSFFNNGAMDEGYADFWAYSITQQAIIGLGTNLSNVNNFIRRYDINRKVYPVNIVGEVHADGEIIAGAWWDTYVLLGNDMNLTTQLFADAFPGYQAEVFNGNEGQAFTDVLIDVLQADDNDGDLTNGTPNGMAIATAFDLHGITLISNASLTHTPVLSSPEATGITLFADLNLTFPYTDYVDQLFCNYRINQGSWFTTPLSPVSGNTYSAAIPGQTNGTIVSYFLGATDLNGNTSAVLPFGANAVNPSLPYFIMVGYALYKTHDSDGLQQFGNWTLGAASDNATNGQWEEGDILGSFMTFGVPSTVVQPETQNTAGGTACFYTKNAPNPDDAAGTADVDGGATTLLSPMMDLSSYLNPAISYYRWYTNSKGVNPNADWWQVMITGDGTNWVYVENTPTSEHDWRRNVIRVQDFITPTSTVQLKFIASDSIRPTVSQNGGSLVEAAVDDVMLWDEININGVEESTLPELMIFPNPGNGNFFIALSNAGQISGSITVCDLTGREVYLAQSNGVSLFPLDLTSLSSGCYLLRFVSKDGIICRNVVIEK